MYNTIYPAYNIHPYTPVNTRRITRKQDEEKSSHSSKSAENETQNEQRQSKGAAYFPNGEKVAIDYTKSRIGIDKVLADFRNTASAIGTPPEVQKEVDAYLELVENQIQKDIPNKQIISANLKSASQILDEYITKSLKKPSKVVENWVETLFLQQIDLKPESASSVAVKDNLKSEETEKTPDIEEKVDLKAEEEPEVQAENTEINENPENNGKFYVPQNAELKKLFIRAKKYASSDDKNKALIAFQNVCDYAGQTGDFRVEAMACFEQGKIYDEFDMVEDALFNYHKAAKTTDDNNIKAKAYMSMGKIYDDYVKFESAVDHYAAAVTFSGEADNMKLQAKALSHLAQIHADRYNKPDTVMFMDLSSIAAEETGDAKVKGLIYGRNAKICEKLDDNAAALHYYGDAAREYSSIDDNVNLARNYMSAADIMLGYGNEAKARKLLSKAYAAALQTDNPKLKASVTEKFGRYNLLHA